MAYSGKQQATDASDLFAKIINFITGDSGVPGRDWVSVHTSGEEVVLRNDGLMNNNLVYIGIKLEVNPSNGVDCGLVCKSYKHFDPALMSFYDDNYGNKRGNVNTDCMLAHWNGVMNYWIFSDSSRVIIVVNTQGMYAQAYTGGYTTYFPSTVHPQPLACIADSILSKNGSTWYTYINYNENWSPRNGLYTSESIYSSRYSLLFSSPRILPTSDARMNAKACNSITNIDGSWIQDWAFVPTTWNTQGHIETSRSPEREDWMGRSYTHLPSIGSIHVRYPGSTVHALMPTYIVAVSGNNTYRALLGHLTGVKYCPGTFLTSESVIGNHIIFPNVDRTSPTDWIAIEQV